MKYQKISRKKLNIFRTSVIEWYKKYGRPFFWRDSKLNSWQWLLLEILLKRTNANTVNIYGKKILKKYSLPYTIQKVSECKLKKDLKIFGLKNQRTKALVKLSNILIKKYESNVPSNYDLLISLPYIGHYTANAILCFHYNIKRPIIDVNVARIYSRCFGLIIPKDLRDKELLLFTSDMVPEDRFTEYNYGLLDLGAQICKTNTPMCKQCVLSQICDYQ